MRTLESEIELLERELNLLESVVLVARERASGEDPEWEKHKAKVLENMCNLVLAYKMEDPPHKAVAILNRMFADAREIAQQKYLIQQFDEKRKRLHTLRAQEESRKEAVKEAERLREEMSWRATG